MSNASITFDKNSLKSLNNRLKKLEQEIINGFHDKRNFDGVLEKAKNGLKENTSLVKKNSPRYEQLKKDLRSQGIILHDTPLQVTGKLVEDLKYKLLDKSPSELTVAISFSEDTRLRPTIGSMIASRNKGQDELVYKASKSSEVAARLEAMGWPISNALYKSYGKDFVIAVEKIISKAFSKA